MNTTKKRLSVLICVVLIIQMFTVNVASAAYVNGAYISSSGACVMDYETGEVLYQYYGYTPRVPASMTKLLNVYCVYDAISKGEITMDTVVPISANVYSKSRNGKYQNVVPLNYGTAYTVSQLLDIVISYSASGASVALAELVGGGSEYRFVARMNSTAKAMGVSANFYDSCGYANNTITPVGMATIARNLIKDYPDVLTRSSRAYVTFYGTTYKSTNYLLDTYYYEGADGLKTGTGSVAGACFCGTAARNGHRLITVTMGSSSTNQRFIDTIRLLDYGFAQLEAREGIFYTDAKTYINGYEVPTFMYKGETSHAVVIAEDLRSYGFDVDFNGETECININYNPEKAYTPIPLESYKNRDGQRVCSVLESNITATATNDTSVVALEDIYIINGYTCISVDELSKVYGFTWNDAEKAAYITADN